MKVDINRNSPYHEMDPLFVRTWNSYMLLTLFILGNMRLILEDWMQNELLIERFLFFLPRRTRTAALTCFTSSQAWSRSTLLSTHTHCRALNNKNLFFMKSNEVYCYMKSVLKLVLNYWIKKSHLNENKFFFRILEKLEINNDAVI